MTSFGGKLRASLDKKTTESYKRRATRKANIQKDLLELVRVHRLAVVAVAAACPQTERRRMKKRGRGFYVGK